MNRKAEELIERAFEMARASGKPSWQRMTLPVLKNRILIATRRQFTESDYGARTFAEFVSRCTNVRIRWDNSPPVAELIVVAGQPLREDPVDQNQVSLPFAPQGPSVASSQARSVAPSDRIRPDLWRAIMDYSGGKKYVWDQTTRSARATENPLAGDLVLPTIGPQDMAKWRRAFADQTYCLDADHKARLEKWATEGLPTVALPREWQGLWNAFLKRQVVERIDRWFSEANLTAPTDAVITDRAREDRGSDEQLRTLVLDCVQSMSSQELRRLLIPATALLRSTDRRRQ